MTTCAAWGTKLQGHAKFCHECGAAVTSTLAALWGHAPRLAATACAIDVLNILGRCLFTRTP
jgi:hypothetical protein